MWSRRPRNATFRDRTEAGAALAGALDAYRAREDGIVLGLPRGGVPVAAEVARALALPLDVFVVRKLGVPGHEELAFGAIASGGTRVLNDDVLAAVGIPADTVARVTATAQAELAAREHAYRNDRPLPSLEGRVVLVADDGLATGASMRAAVVAVRALGAAHVVVAVPVGAAPTCDALRAVADDVVCAMTPEAFIAVGRWYDDFTQTTDAEVRAALAHVGDAAGAERRA